MRNRREKILYFRTFVIENVGSETPIIKPKNPPKKNITILFMLSFVFLLVNLQPKEMQMTLQMNYDSIC